MPVTDLAEGRKAHVAEVWVVVTAAITAKTQERMAASAEATAIRQNARIIDRDVLLELLARVS